MTYRGMVKNGKIELEAGAALPDGTPVQVEAVAPAPDPLDGLADEAVQTGLPDLASQHDHYVYGIPKNEE